MAAPRVVIGAELLIHPRFLDPDLHNVGLRHQRHADQRLHARRDNGRAQRHYDHARAGLPHPVVVGLPIPQDRVVEAGRGLLVQ